MKEQINIISRMFQLPAQLILIPLFSEPFLYFISYNFSLIFHIQNSHFTYFQDTPSPFFSQPSLHQIGQIDPIS